MKEIAVQELSSDKFSVYGTFQSLTDTQAPHLGAPPCEFYRDMGVVRLSEKNAGISVTRVYQRPHIIDELEYHSHTAEAIVPLDGDILIHVGAATANGIVPYDALEVFRVPQYTLVVMNPGVWHCGPFGIASETVNVLVVLPERAYANDCTVVKLPPEKQLQII